MFSLLRRLCTILGFFVVLLALLFYSQRYWLNPAIRYLVSDFTEYRWRADSIEWMATWPMEFEIKQLQLRYREGITPEDFIRAPHLYITLGAIPWKEARLQIRHIDAQIEIVNWIRFPAVPLSAARIEAEKKAPFYKGITVQTLQMEVMGIAYFDRVRDPIPPPQIYVLNLKTPLIRGPIQSLEQLESLLLPGFSKSKRGSK